MWKRSSLWRVRKLFFVNQNPLAERLPTIRAGLTVLRPTPQPIPEMLTHAQLPLGSMRGRRVCLHGEELGQLFVASNGNSSTGSLQR